jgi:uncharacterized protein
MQTPKIVTEFREGLAEGKLLVQQCKDCGKPNMWPRYACPHCQSEKDLPYAIGVVKLDEGVQLAVRLVPNAPDDWSGYQCDDRVEFVAVSAEQIEKRPYATFKRVAG